MAIQRDYILRLIEMMGEFFRRLAEIADEWERGRELNDACRDQCGLSLDAAMTLSDETLMGLLPPRALLTLSEITYLKAKSIAMDEIEREQLYLRTLRLLASLHEEETLCEARGMRLRELMDACAEQMEAADYLSCARFFLSGVRLEDCEDAVFMAVELKSDPSFCIQQGKEIFQEMLHLPESVLLPGGMTRDDVKSAMDDLEAWGKA